MTHADLSVDVSDDLKAVGISGTRPLSNEQLVKVGEFLIWMGKGGRDEMERDHLMSDIEHEDEARAAENDPDSEEANLPSDPDTDDDVEERHDPFED